MAASLSKCEVTLDVTIIEPLDIHYYQAKFTLVGGGCFSADASIHEEIGFTARGYMTQGSGD